MKEMECECKICQGFCEHKPGWFLPEEIKLVEEHFGMSFDRLLGTKLAVDWWVGDGKNILILAPQIKSNENIQYPEKPFGKCVFFKGGKCEIHKIKPYECRMSDHTSTLGHSSKMHRDVMKIWKDSDLLKDYEDEVEFEEKSLVNLFYNI